MSDTTKPGANGEDELSPEEHRALEEALARSVRPEPLAEARHEAILARVGLAPAPGSADDGLGEPDEREAEAARRFAEALDAGAAHPDVELARALSLAFGADEAALQRGEAASEQALASALPARRRSPAKVLFVGFGAAGAALALAASVFLGIGLEEQAPEPRAELLLSRSVAPLLGPEPSELSASDRLDRITAARSRDYRANRYATWGVR